MLSLLHTASGLLIRVRNLFIFPYFSTKIYVVGTLKNRLNETVLLSIQMLKNNKLEIFTILGSDFCLS